MPLDVRITMTEDQPTSKSVDRVQLFHRLARLVLRTIPFVPAPELYDLLTDLQKSRTELDGKVRRAVESLREASEVVAELETELSQQMGRTEHLREEYEKYSKLAQIEEEKAAALIRQLQQTVDKGKDSERWISFGINIVAGLIIFLVGVVLGPWLMRFLGL
jgi:predicted RNase H-like nuclease (RuvC/YqgF family)